MQTAKNVGGVLGSGLEGYQTGARHGKAIAGAAHSFDQHMKGANMSAIGGKPFAHDALVRKYANNQTAAMMKSYYNRSLPRQMPGPEMLPIIRTALEFQWQRVGLLAQKDKCRY